MGILSVRVDVWNGVGVDADADVEFWKGRNE